MLDDTEGVMKKDKPEKLAKNIGYTRHRTNTC